MAVEKDPLQDLKNQFAEMHESLDEIAKNTEPPAEVAKAHIHERRTSAPNQKVDLGKDTKKQILDALKNIRNQIVVSQHRENTMSDVAAEALASGQSLAGAAKEALGFKRDKLKASFKRKFDPLNIVHRITGGSKLATVLAGKAMGRSEQSIRSAAGLQPLAETPTPFMGGQDSGAPSPVASDKATTALESMATTLTQILKELTEFTFLKKMETASDEERDAKLEQWHDEEVDAAAAGAVHESQLPTQIDKNGKPVEKKEDSSFMKLLMPALIALGALIVETIIPVFTKLSKIATELLDGLMYVVKYIEELTGKVLGKGLEAVKGIGSSIIEGGKSLLGKVTGKVAATVAAPLAGKMTGAGAKVAAPGAAKAAGAISGATIKEIVKKQGVKVVAKTASKVIPLVGLGFALKNLIDGEYTQATIDAAMGLASVPSLMAPGVGSAAVFATGLAATIANQVYKEVYGLEPLSDPEVANRMPELVEESTKFVSDFLSPKAEQQTTSTTDIPSLVTPGTPGVPSSLTGAPNMTAMTPTEIPAPAPMTGQTLTQANDLQRNAATEAPGGGKNTAAVINNVNNQVTNAPTFNQGMPPARSGESSYQRSLDRHYVPA